MLFQVGPAYAEVSSGDETTAVQDEQQRIEQERSQNEQAVQDLSNDEEVVFSDGSFKNRQSDQDDMTKLLDTLVVLAMMLVGVSAVVACGLSLAPSFWLYISAIVIYAFAEMTFHKEHKGNTIKITQGMLKDDDERDGQVKRLRAAAKAKMEQKKTVEKRAAAITAAAITMGLAGALAFFEANLKQFSLLTCKAAGIAYPSNITCGGPMGSNITSFSLQERPGSAATCADVQTAVGTSTAVSAACAACTPAAATQQSSFVCCAPGVLGFNNQRPLLEKMNLLGPGDSSDKMYLARSMADIIVDGEIDHFENEDDVLAKKFILEADSEIEALFIQQEWASFFAGKYSSPSIDDYEMAKGLAKHYPDLSARIKDQLLSTFDSLEQMIFPKAYAGDEQQDSMIKIGGAAIVATVLAIRFGFANSILSMIGGSTTRGMLFLGFALMMNAGAETAKGQGKEYEGQAKQYLMIANQLENPEFGGSQIENLADKELNDLVVALEAPEAGIYGDMDGTNCISADKGGDGGYDPDCSCKKDKTCLGIKPLTENFPGAGEFTLPSIIRTTGNDAIDMANSISRGRPSLSEGNIDKINQRGNAALKTRKAIEKSLNETLIKAGKKPIDFNKKAKALVKNLRKQAFKQVQKSGKDKLLKELKQVSIGKVDKKKGKKKLLSKAKPAQLVQPKGAPAGGNFKFDIEDPFADTDDEKTIANEGGIAKDISEEYEITDNAIHDENGPSIFELLSNRYTRSIKKLFPDKK